MIDARVFPLCLLSLLPATTVAFLCAVGDLPTGLSVNRHGEPLLTCQRSQCLVQSEDLGYTNMDCGEGSSNACLRQNTFVLAFSRPEESTKTLSLLCCKHPSLALRNKTKSVVVHKNTTITVGGPILSPIDKREVGFNLIKNIVKIVGDNNQISYRVTTDRADCRIRTNARGPTENVIRAKLKELHKKEPSHNWKGLLPTPYLQNLPFPELLTVMGTPFERV